MQTEHTKTNGTAIFFTKTAELTRKSHTKIISLTALYFADPAYVPDPRYSTMCQNLIAHDPYLCYLKT